MLKGQLSKEQRDAAWEGKDLAERKAMTAHNLNMAGEETARASGVRVSAVGVGRNDDYTERKKREDRFRDAMLRSQLTPEAEALYNALGNYENDLRDELARRQRRSEELNDKIGATEAVLLLIQNEELDRSNTLHQELLARAELDPELSDEELEQEAEENLDEDRQERSENDARITEIERQLPHIEVARQMLEDGNDPEEVLRFLESKRIHIDVDSLDGDHVFESIARREVELRQEAHHATEAEASSDASATDMIESDQEIETFMQALATNQQTMMLEGAALVDAMRGQIDNLSDDAREQLSISEDTAFLFEEPEVAPQQEATAGDPQNSIESRDPNLENSPGNNL